MRAREFGEKLSRVGAGERDPAIEVVFVAPDGAEYEAEFVDEVSYPGGTDRAQVEVHLKERER